MTTQKFSTKLTVPQMKTIAVLIAATEYEKYEVSEILERAEQIATNEAEYQQVVDAANSWEDSPIYAGSWSKSPSTVKF